MLSIFTIARIIVNASRSVSVPTFFDTGLILISDGFTSTAETYKDAV